MSTLAKEFVRLTVEMLAWCNREAAQSVVAADRELDEMAGIARRMLADALSGFIRWDAVLAREVCRRDDQVDALHDSDVRILLTHMMQDPRRIEPAMALVSKNLERIADLATNIAEDEVFVVEGRMIKHGVGRNGPAQ